MAEKFLVRFRALIAVLFNRPLSVRLRRDGVAWFYPAHNLVLPCIAGADGDGDGDGGGDGEDGEDGDGDGSGDGNEGDGEDGDGDEGDGVDDAPGPDATADEWKQYARRWESRAKGATTGRKLERANLKVKRAEARAEELFNKLKKREDADKSEQEKAVEKAKEEGRSEALTKAEKDRRSDRLESAVIRAAGKKIKVGEGDDAKTLRFEDPEDAETFLRHRISRGDIDEDELFDESGKVKTDVVNEYLKEILEEKPRLAEDSGPAKEKKKTADGAADGGKGGETKAPDELSVEEHVKRLDKSKS